MTIKQFILLTRPHTLIASLTPVSVALLLSYKALGSINIYTGLLCILVALFAQILSNVLNDLYDYRQGADFNRKGFERPLASGKVSLRSIIWVTIFWLTLTVVTGLLLLYQTTPWLLAIGVLVLLGAWGYTAGKNSIAYLGGGEIAVFIFFGWIAVTIPYFIQTGNLSADIFFTASAIGVVNVNIMVVNNYRDIDEDRNSGKRTLFVRFGKDLAHKLYISNVLLSVFLLFPILNKWSIIAAMGYIGFMIKQYKKFFTFRGKELNKLLAKTSLGVLLHGLVIATTLLRS